MAPIRRYLRITKYSVLECRIYLDNPALAESWLLNPRNPILPRVIESVRPFVLPKLREENERSKGKSKQKKGVKDVVVEDDFEVSIFLTDNSSRHSLLYKQKFFRNLDKKDIQSNSQKLLGETNEAPIEVDDAEAVVIREESEDDAGVNISDLPDAPTDEGNISDTEGLFVEDNTSTIRRSKRTHAPTTANGVEPTSSSPESAPASKRRRGDVAAADNEMTDDKKKMAMDTSYDGFSIYGRVLCLVVKRKDKKGKQTSTNAGQAMMEDWITATQIPAQEED